MPVPPTGHSSSIGSTSSYGSSKSSLLAFPIDPLSSQSDITDPNPPVMPRGDAAAYALAASPSHAAYKANNPASASQKFKRAFAKRRKPSQDATSLLSSGDERLTPDVPPAASSSHPRSGVTPPSNSRPSTAKLTMHLFGGRKQNQPPQSHPDKPPPPPPKPAAMRALPALQTSTRPRSSILLVSPSINPALEFMREDEARRRVHDLSTPELDQNKEDWRKSDSTVASGHTLRASRFPDAAPSTAAKRRSTYSASPNELGLSLDLVSESSAPDKPRDTSAGKQAKRRSLSLNVNITPRQLPAPSFTDPAAPARTSSPSSLPLPGSAVSGSSPARSPSPVPGPWRATHSPPHSVSLSPASHDVPTLTRTAASGIIGSGTASGSPVSKSNIRGRLAAWTAAAGQGSRSSSPLGASSMSSPSLSNPSVTSFHETEYRRMPVMSTASQPSLEVQAVVAAVRDIETRTRSQSGSSTGAGGIRTAATSLTSGAGAIALGFGKRAYEKVGRVWGGAGSGSGSGSDTPRHYHSTPATPSGDDLLHAPHHAPSAFAAYGRRTHNAPSGTWSVSSLSGGSRSSSERDSAGGRNTPPNWPGRLVRPPRSTGGGVVFGRELWECVRETRASVPRSHPLSERMIPALVLRCAHHLHKWGIQEEGLFRISGRSSHINRLRQEFDSGADYDIIDCSPSELDPHAVASVFKAYLRELPEPILTRALAPLFDTAMNAESNRAASTSPIGPAAFMPKPVGSNGSNAPALPSSPRALPMIRKPPSLSTFTLPTSTSLRAPSTSLVETLADLVARLPRENRDLLLTVVDLMRATAAQSKETKMPLSNLLLVFCPSLSMGPTLLRVLCDTPGVWDRPRGPPVVEIVKPPAATQDEGEESDDSDLDLVSSYGEAQIVALPPMNKNAEGETLDEDAQSDVPARMATPPEGAEPPPRSDLPLSAPLARPHAVRRVPVPGIVLDDPYKLRTAPYSRSFTPPPFTERLPQYAPISASASTPSLLIPTRSTTPLPVVPHTSPSSPESAHASPFRGRQSSAPSLSFVHTSVPVFGAPDHNKDLPASPRSFLHPEAEDRARSTPPLRVVTVPPERKSSRVSPLFPPSRSAPSVVFPTPKTPTTPTSPKKHGVSLSIGQQAKVPSDGEGSSPPKRLMRRPSLNMLFNMKRTGSPSPRSRTPTISSPLNISSPLTSPSPRTNSGPLIISAPIARSPSVESSPRTITNPFPPVLSLPLDASTDAGLGLGWDDVFGRSSANEPAQMPPVQSLLPLQPRPMAVSQPSSPPWRKQTTPPSTPRRPTTEFLLSSGGFFSASGPPLALPSPASVLEGASLGTGARAASPRDGVADPATLQEDSSSGPDSPEVDSPMKDLFTPPPQLSFQLRRSSMEEDWASAVLMAAGKPAEPLA